MNTEFVCTRGNGSGETVVVAYLHGEEHRWESAAASWFDVLEQEPDQLYLVVLRQGYGKVTGEGGAQDCDDTIMFICLELFLNPWVELKPWSAVEPVKLGFSWVVTETSCLVTQIWSHARLRLWRVLIVPFDSTRWRMILSSRFLRRLLITTSLSTSDSYYFFP